MESIGISSSSMLFTCLLLELLWLSGICPLIANAQGNQLSALDPIGQVVSVPHLLPSLEQGSCGHIP